MKKWFKKIKDMINEWFNPKPPTPPDPYPDAIHPGDIKWLGVNVGPWIKKYTLRVEIGGSRIVYDQQGTTDWSPKPEAGREDMTGNPWIITDEFDGTWVAATHEWMTKGQKVKGARSVHGDHIKRREFGGDNWKQWIPTPGRRYGWCVSGLCRGTQRNQQERTQIVFFTWPAGVIMSSKAVDCDTGVTISSDTNNC